MQNKVLPENEVKVVKELIEKVKELREVHAKGTPIVLSTTTQVERIQSVLYLRILKEFLTDASALESLMVSSEDEFIKEVTHNGEMSLDDVEKSLILSALSDMLS